MTLHMEPYDGPPDKGRLIAALRGEPIDRVPNFEVLKPGGRWIAGSSHSIVNYIPHENFVAMINAIHRYGRY